MAVDYSRLKATLSQSKVQSENNALFQTIFNIITGGEENNTQINSEVQRLEGLINGLRAVTIIEVDTSLVAPTYELAAYVAGGAVVFKDVSGNASVNNITLTGTVDGIVNPVISTDYGLFRVFKSISGTLFTW